MPRFQVLRFRFLDWLRRWPLTLRRRVEWIGIGFLGVMVLVVAFRQPMSERIYPEARATQVLDAAANALHQGRLSSPDGTGARELYSAALAMDPDRDEARIGLQQVGEAALAEAAKATLEKRFLDARKALRLARELSVPRARADAVAESLRQQEAGFEGVDRLLAQADAARKARHLDGDDEAALPLYRHVLELQPSNNAALEGREDALSDLLQQAQDKLSKREYTEASELVARVREYDAGHVGLPDAQAALTQARDRERARADRAWRRRSLDEAGDAYLAMLALDPNDEAARDGLERTALAWATYSERAASDFRFDDAQRSLQQARTLVVDVPGIASVATPAIASAERHLQQSRSREARLPMLRVTPAQQAEIRRLLAGAAEAEARGDLLTPPGDSAFDRVRRARAIAPNDPAVAQAQTRLLPAAQRCFDNALRANDLVQARACLDARAQLGDSSASVRGARNRLALRWIAVGEERLRAGELPAAQRALNTARELDPSADGLDAFAERTRAASRGEEGRF
jgi:hypothetical protein